MVRELIDRVVNIVSFIKLIKKISLASCDRTARCTGVFEIPFGSFTPIYQSWYQKEQTNPGKNRHDIKWQRECLKFLAKVPENAHFHIEMQLLWSMSQIFWPFLGPINLKSKWLTQIRSLFRLSQVKKH